MERIKEALNGARAERDRRQALNERDSGVARRLRLFSSFEHLGEDARRAVVALGEVLELDPGQSVCALGEHDDCVHYLLEGIIRIETADGVSRALHAGVGPARDALDEVGYKTASIVATHPTRIFRINPARIASALETAEVQPLPAAAYSETFTGQQLAMLVGALRDEHRGMNAAVADSDIGGAAPEVLVGERSLGVELELPDLESTRAPPFVRDDAARAAAPAMPTDALSGLTRAFELDLRRYIEGFRRDERARVQARLKAYAGKLKQRAEDQVRANVQTLRNRFALASKAREAALAAREQELSKRYEQLLALANRLSRQKAEIYQAQHQIEEKFKHAEQLHRELAELGSIVTGHLDQIDEMLPIDAGELDQQLGTELSA